MITDWTMPDITGVELCPRIRNDFREHYAHLILVTSNTNKEHVIEGLAAGADDYLTKPFHPGELVARIGVGCRFIDLHRQIQTKNQQLEELALTDALTGLPNRRAIEGWAQTQLSAAARHGYPLWVVMADLDHFKRINDTYGHEAGDKVLKQFSELLKLNTRSSNICGRLGGEEFVLVLTHVDKEQVTIAIERIQRCLAMEEFRFGEAKTSITASFGMALFEGSKSSAFSGLLADADSALYAAKKGGRNRIQFFSI